MNTPTKAQLKFLSNIGINSTGLTRDECAAIISRYVEAHAVIKQLNRAQAFAESPKTRKLYRDALKLIKSLL